LHKVDDLEEKIFLVGVFMVSKRVNYTSSFKAKVALAAVKGEFTMSQLSSHFKVHPQVISKWKSHLVSNIESVFQDGRRKKPTVAIDVEGLYSKIGRLEMENDFLKKKSDELSSLY
jgi:transposase-like protein